MSYSKKKVTFNPVVRGVAILSIYDYTDSERNAAWYNQDEMDRITQRAIKIITIMESADETQKYCMRGLEGHTRSGTISRKHSRSEAREAVFREQDRQFNEGCINDQAIANAYIQATSKSQIWANSMGQQDQKAAVACLSQGEDEGEAERTAPGQPHAFLGIPAVKLQANPETSMKTKTGSWPNYRTRAPAA